MSVEPAATGTGEQTNTALTTRVRGMSRAEPCVDMRWWPLQFRLGPTQAVRVGPTRAVRTTPVVPSP
jgi:hypothetical protein